MTSLLCSKHQGPKNKETLWYFNLVFVEPCLFCMHFGFVMFYPCLFCPSDNVWRSRRADAPRCAHFSIVITPSWITQWVSVGKCAHRGSSTHPESQNFFKIVTWPKQTWTKHHNTCISLWAGKNWQSVVGNEFYFQTVSGDFWPIFFINQFLLVLFKWFLQI